VPVLNGEAECCRLLGQLHALYLQEVHIRRKSPATIAKCIMVTGTDTQYKFFYWLSLLKKRRTLSIEDRTHILFFKI
jgi:hypothetical protein